MSAADESSATPSAKGTSTGEPPRGAKSSSSPKPQAPSSVAGSQSSSPAAGPSFFLRKEAQVQKAAAEKRKPKGFATGSGQAAQPGKSKGAKRSAKKGKSASKSVPKATPRSKSKRASGAKKKQSAGQGQEPSTPQFTPEQNSVIQKVLSEHKNVFFTGAAGTGKSFVLKHIIRKLSEQLDETQFSTTAPSGIAAFNIGGMTIHSFAGIGFGDAPVEKLLHEMARKRNVLKRWHMTRVLIIDEVSMLSGELLDKLNTIAKRIRQNDSPFGGIQLVVTGDFFQLPPVKAKLLAFESQCWEECIADTIVLSRIFRQTSSDMVTALNKIRIGICDQEVEDILEPCLCEGKIDAATAARGLLPASSKQKSASKRAAQMKTETNGASASTGAAAVAVSSSESSRGEKAAKEEEEEEEDKIEATILHSHNAVVDRVNSQRLAMIKNPPHVYKIVDWDSDTVYQRHLKIMRRGFTGVDTLTLKLGCNVVLLTNLDTTTGLCNGSQGIVVGFVSYAEICAARTGANINGLLPQAPVTAPEMTPGLKLHEIRVVGVGDELDGDPPRLDFNPQARYPVVRFHSSYAEGGFGEQRVLVVPHTWRKEEVTGTGKDRSTRLLASRKQVPLRLSWAMSIHKAQGMTIDRLRVDIGNVFECGHAYVGLSRATSLEGLSIHNMTPKTIRANPKVKAFYRKVYANQTRRAFWTLPIPPPQTHVLLEWLWKFLSTTMLRSVPGLDWSVVREQHLPLFLDNAGEVLSFDTFWKKVLASGAKHKGIPTKSTSDADKKRWAAWYPKAFQIVIAAVFFDFLFGPEAEKAALARMAQRQEPDQRNGAQSYSSRVGAVRQPGLSASSSPSRSATTTTTNCSESTAVNRGFTSAAEMAAAGLQSRAHALMTQPNKVPRDVLHYVQYLEGKKAVLERKASLLSDFLVGKGFNLNHVLTSSSPASQDSHAAKRPRLGALASSPASQPCSSASQGTPTQSRGRQLTDEQMRKVQMNRALAMKKKELRKQRSLEQQRLAANAARNASPSKP